MTAEGAVDAALFRIYVQHALVPTLRPGDVVVMDNLSVQKVAGIESMIAGPGARLVYLPSYFPDCSPIEPCWSKIKTAITRHEGQDKANASSGSEEGDRKN